MNDVEAARGAGRDGLSLILKRGQGTRIDDLRLPQADAP